ncbi:phasin family protein [Massilia sp. MP_M2]|uniref:phasin family protein n=1 Tax=Massilia sp. MP_M2 TaxID=3071713 RepID=UPI00319EA41A
MTSLSEQLSAAPNHYLTAPMNAQLTMLNAFATQALESASRITALNLTTSQQVLERSAQTARQLIGARDARDLAVLRSHAEEQVHSLFAYSRELLGIAVGAQPILLRSATPAPVTEPVAEMAQVVVDAGNATADTVQAAAERTIDAVAVAPTQAPVAVAPTPVAEAPEPEIEAAPAVEAAPQPAPTIDAMAGVLHESAPDDAAPHVLPGPAAAKPTPIAQAAGNGAVLAATPPAPAAAPIERRDPDAPATAATPRRRRK